MRKPHAYCYCYEVPPPTLPDELLSMLTGGVASDLTLEAAYGEAPPMYAPLHPHLLPPAPTLALTLVPFIAPALTPCAGTSLATLSSSACARPSSAQPSPMA